LHMISQGRELFVVEESCQVPAAVSSSKDSFLPLKSILPLVYRQVCQQLGRSENHTNNKSYVCADR
jgi:hypothetical protein